MDNATSQIQQLFFGLGCALALASAAALLLKRVKARGQPHAVIDNLLARVWAWWVMVGLVGLAAWFGRNGLILLSASASFFALREFLTVTPTRRGDHLVLFVSFFLVLPVQFFLVWIDWYGLYSIFIPVYAFLALPILAGLSGDTTQFLQRAATIQWGLMVCVFCVSFLPALIDLRIPGFEGRNLLLFVYPILVVQTSDVLQYVFGKLFGRHRIAPHLSPSKTVEGFLGGTLLASAIGAALWRLTPFSPLQAFGLSAVTTLTGFCGGLVMSAIKRDRGVKDWGTMIEGHGGMLDRLDSICFSAPVFFHLVRYWFTP